MKIVISSGHSKNVRGASGPEPWGLDEVNEARRVVDTVASLLAHSGVEVVSYHDDVSESQSENLERIVDFHNSQGPHELSVSIHFNAYETTPNPMGTECLYLTQQALAEKVASAIAIAGDLIDRGDKQRTDLYFLNQTAAPAILIEVCFVDSFADVDAYHTNFAEICEAITETIREQDLIA